MKRAIERGKLDQDAADALIGRVTTTTELHALADADLVIEAVDELPEEKGTCSAR